MVSGTDVARAGADVDPSGLDAASSGPAAPIVNSEERKFFRFILTIELILLRQKIA